MITLSEARRELRSRFGRTTAEVLINQSQVAMGTRGNIRGWSEREFYRCRTCSPDGRLSNLDIRLGLTEVELLPFAIGPVTAAKTIKIVYLATNLGIPDSIPAL